MADFNPRFKAANDPSYIGYSKEGSGKTSLAGLVKDIGSTGILTVNTLDEINQDEIKAQIKAGSTDALAGTTTAAPGAADVPTDTVDEGVAETTSTDTIFGEEKTSASVPEIAQGAKRAEKLTSALKAGKISNTAYWGQMAALSKQLKARYSGYEDVIDKQFQGVTGQIPANALAETKRTEYLKGVATAASDEKQFNSFIKSNIQYLPADYFDRVKAGKPYSQLDTYSYVHKVRSQEHELNYRKDKIAAAHAEGNLQEETAVGEAQNTLNTRADAILGETATVELIDGIRAAQAKGNLVTPQDKEKIRVGYGQLSLKMEQALEDELRKPTSDGKETFYSLIRDPGKVKAIREQAMSRLNFVKQLVEDDHYGVLGSTLNNVKAMQDDATNRLLKEDDYFALADAIVKNGGGPLITEHFADPAFKAFRDRGGAALGRVMTGQAVDQMNMAKVAAGKPEPVVEAIKKVWAQPTVPMEEKKAQARGAIEANIRGLVSPNATTVSSATAAENLYGKANSNFLAHFPAAQQNEMYAKLVSEPVTDKMAEVRATRPDLWDRYRDWAKGSFLALQRTNAATIQEGVSQRENIDIEYDSSTNQFKTKLTEKGKEEQRKQLQGTDTFLSGFEEAFTGDTDRAVTNLNKQIKILEKVLKVDGKDVSQEIATLLGVMDINTMTGKQQTFFQRVRQAIDTELNPPEADKK